MRRTLISATNAIKGFNRYDTATNDFAKGYPERGLNTFYKPERGQKYYDEQLKGDLERGGKL